MIRWTDDPAGRGARELRERTRTRAFTDHEPSCCVVASLAGRDHPHPRSGTTGPTSRRSTWQATPAALTGALARARAAQGKDLTVRAEGPAAAERDGRRRRGRRGGDRRPRQRDGPGAVVEKELSDGLRATIAQGVAAGPHRPRPSATRACPPERIAELGPAAGAERARGRPRRLRPAGTSAVGYIVAVVLYLALLFSGAIRRRRGWRRRRRAGCPRCSSPACAPSELLLGQGGRDRRDGARPARRGGGAGARWRRSPSTWPSCPTTTGSGRGLGRGLVRRRLRRSTARDLRGARLAGGPPAGGGAGRPASRPTLLLVGYLGATVVAGRPRRHLGPDRLDPPALRAR